MEDNDKGALPPDWVHTQVKWLIKEKKIQITVVNTLLEISSSSTSDFLPFIIIYYN